MTKLPNDNYLKSLSDENLPNSITLYIPHVSSTTAKSQDRIRFKNMVQAAEKRLGATPLTNKEINKMLRPAKELHDDLVFWRSNGHDLAVFISQEQFKYKQLPQGTVEQQLSIGRGFNLDQIRSLQDSDAEFYLLALDHKDVQLYKGSHYDLEKVKVGGLSENLEESLNIDEHPTSLQVHNHKEARGGRNSHSYHGQYNVAEEDKKLLKKFFRKIDGIVKNHLKRDNSPPLLIAGVDHMVAIYKQVGSYSNLLGTPLKKNIKHLDKNKVRETAWELVNSQV